MKCAGDLLPAAGHRRILAFVGPTGVGKTTTIAKIAADAQLVRKLRVGLITVDTFRMAAVEQLARYAEILECPLVVVKQPEELPAALDELADCDLILVDTTGRSPRAADQVAALTRYFPEGWGGEVVLTVAASTRERDLHASVDAFIELDYAYLCVTKLDETDALGAVYSVARRPVARSRG
jgi:flagellar biosynthesis protein FlhF